MYKIAITSRFISSHYFIYQSYYQFLKAYFDIEIVLPRSSRQYEDIVLRNDALLISGGDDIDPRLYHQETLSMTHLEEPLIERLDFDLIEQFHHHHKVIIGICRGIQIINVYFGGTLYQDIPTQYFSPINHQKEKHNLCFTGILAHYFPSPSLVNSYHHQVIQTPAPHFQVIAISEDGLIEGISYQNILGVQWHPEKMNLFHQRQFLQLIIDMINNSTS